MPRKDHRNKWSDKEVEAHWDRVAGIYVSENEKVKQTHDQRFRESVAYLNLLPGMKVLNITSRDAEAADYIQAACKDVEVINAEISMGLMDVAASLRPEITQVKIETYAQLPFDDGEFDRVLSLETLEHCADPIMFLKELYRVSTQQTKLVLSCPPATAELPYQLYSLLFGGHGEGPHRFPKSKEVKQMFEKSGWKLKHHKGTLLVPVGPAGFQKWGEKLIDRYQNTFLSELGIRQFFVVKKPNNIKQVIDSGLCNRCGTCVGLSLGKIKFRDRTGLYLPEITGPLTGEEEKTLFQACSGKGFDFPGEQKRIFGEKTNRHPYTGTAIEIYIGHATDEQVRRNSASGGILSAILVWMLEKKMIDGVVTLAMSEEEPWLTKPIIATTKEEILASAQSKYIISSVNEILPEISAFDGTLAYVGLPGQVQSIRLLQKMGHPSVRNIRYIFGPFYGNTLHFSSVKSFIRSFGRKDYREITRLYFRYGEWPGKMRVEFSDGEHVELPKFHANYLIPFHILKNSLLCTDLSNEFTDISGGDAWAPKYEERGKGFSMVLARSETGKDILDRMVSAGALVLDPITTDDAITMHSHGYDLKKRGTFIRLRFRRLFGQRVPDYGYVIKGFSLQRYLMEIVLSSMFLILGTRPARFMAERIPPKSIGRLFEKTRVRWKKSTHKIKRSNLG
jgi:coenzyme F420 hydrogenase subunit beta